MTFLGFATAAAGAQQPVGPPAATAAAKDAMSDTVRGNALRVRLLTVGQGDLVFERYGHNMLWITDTRTNESLVWNWGVFSFDQPHFLRRFLFGNNEYIIMPQNAAAELNKYAAENREVMSQELALTPGQRAALDAFVRTNALPENKNYRYDYFLDNCSTRLRDALDIVLDGAISRALTTRSSSLTYRSETLRLNQHSNLLFMGLDLALGVPADAPLSPWEYSFVPMRLRDELMQITVPGPDGALVPLAGPPRVIVDVDREAEPQAIRSWGVRAQIIAGGLMLALIAIGLSVGARAGSSGAAVALTVLGSIVHLVLGILGSLIVFMWAFTLHAFWAWNPHLLVFTPLSVIVAVLLPFAMSRPGLRGLIARYDFTIAITAFLAGVFALVSVARGGGVAPEMLVAWASASWLFHLAHGLALYRAGGVRTGPR